MTRCARVLHVATRFLDGGSERRIEDMVTALNSPGIDHDVAVGPESDLERLSRVPGIDRIHVVPDLHRDVGVNDARGLRQLRRLLTEGSYSLLHTCQSKAGILGRLASVGVPNLRRVHSVTMATFGEGFPARAAVYLRAERLAGRHTDLFLVAGACLRDRYVKAGVAPEQRFRIMRASIDVARFEDAAERRDELRARLGLAKGQMAVAVVGSLSERKGARQLPELVRALRTRVASDAVVLVAGGGPLEAELRASDEAVADQLRVLGYRSDVETVIASADVVVSLSSAEGLPQSLVQAVAARRPIVTYPMDGPPELFAMGAVGRMVREREVVQLARAAAELMDVSGPCLDLAQFSLASVLSEYRSAVVPVLDAQVLA